MIEELPPVERQCHVIWRGIGLARRISLREHERDFDVLLFEQRPTARPTRRHEIDEVIERRELRTHHVAGPGVYDEPNANAGRLPQHCIVQSFEDLAGEDVRLLKVVLDVVDPGPLRDRRVEAGFDLGADRCRREGPRGVEADGDTRDAQDDPVRRDRVHDREVLDVCRLRFHLCVLLS